MSKLSTDDLIHDPRRLMFRALKHVAVECGIVKLPRVPVAENIPSNEMPMYRNLWEHIRKDMPKRGREPKKVEGTMNSPELVRPEAVREPDEQVKSTPHRKLANLHKVLEIKRTVLHSAATIMIASRATFSAGSS